MKNKIISLLVLCILISVSGFSQDSTHNINAKKSIAHNGSHIVLKKQTSLPNHRATIHKKTMYRDTRLGSSSKKYNTYKKNDNGAGAITNNPNK